QDVRRRADRKDVAIADRDVEPGDGLPDDGRVDGAVEERVGRHQEEELSPLGVLEGLEHEGDGDLPGEDAEERERDRPGGDRSEGGPGAPGRQADGSSFSNWRMPRSAKRSRTNGVSRPSRFTLGTIFEKSSFRNSCICAE